MDDSTVIPLDEVIRTGSGGSCECSKLDELDALRALMDTDTIDPAADDTGALYVDGTGKIYCL